MELLHKLKLYADADPANQGTKKPVRMHLTFMCGITRFCLLQLFPLPDANTR